jgi:hypothetical protein
MPMLARRSSRQQARLAYGVANSRPEAVTPLVQRIYGNSDRLRFMRTPDADQHVEYIGMNAKDCFRAAAASFAWHHGRIPPMDSAPPAEYLPLHFSGCNLDAAAKQIKTRNSKFLGGDLSSKNPSGGNRKTLHAVQRITTFVFKVTLGLADMSNVEPLHPGRALCAVQKFNVQRSTSTSHLER